MTYLRLINKKVRPAADGEPRHKGTKKILLTNKKDLIINREKKGPCTLSRKCAGAKKVTWQEQPGGSCR